MKIEEIQSELEMARAELALATAALAPKHKGGEFERFWQAHERCLSFERELARACGQECAVEIKWDAPWDVGAPLPHVVSSGARTCVIYCAKEPDPHWDGTSAQVIDPSVPVRQSIAVVTFEGCLVHKFGAPNDEAISGHRLHGRGLVAYGAHTVERSGWVDEHEKINSVHQHHKPGRYKSLSHYVLVFHDETFECLAASHAVRVGMFTFAEALEECTRAVLL